MARTGLGNVALSISAWHSFVSSLIATIASAMTCSIEKRLTDKEGTFGQGDARGVTAPEALSLYNITPGSALVTQQPKLIWGLIASLFIADVILLFINIPSVGGCTKVRQIPNWLPVPAILSISAVGVYAVHATTFDLVLTAALGAAGYLLRTQGAPMVPLILDFVLGCMMQQNLCRALSMTKGDAGVLVESPISIGLWVGAATMVLLRLFNQRRAAAAAVL
jgi:putative tricarboxylic transport membrane protein